MSNVLQIKRSSITGVVPAVGDLALGELAVNTFDGLLFFKKNDGSDAIITIDPSLISGITDLDGLSDVIISSATSGQVLTHDGSTFVNSDASVLVSNVFTAADETEQLALSANEGDIVLRTDESKSYAHNGGSVGTMADYTELLAPADAVTSVNGQSGTVVLDPDDLDDAATAHKFGSAAQLTKMDYLTVTGAVNLDNAISNTDTLDGGASNGSANPF